MDAPAESDTGVMVHRYHLKFRGKYMYLTIFLDILQLTYEIQRIKLTQF